MLINSQARIVSQGIVSAIEGDGFTANTEDLQRQLVLALGGVPWVVDVMHANNLMLYIVALYLRDNA